MFTTFIIDWWSSSLYKHKCAIIVCLNSDTYTISEIIISLKVRQNHKLKGK